MSLSILQCENVCCFFLCVCVSNHTSIQGQTHFRTELQAITSARLIRNKHGIKIGRVQKWNVILN